MTPFGARIRDLRRQRGVTLKQMAADLHVSPAYLSALEHGRRGRPGPGLVLEVCGYFGLIWDEAEALKRLAALSAPKVMLDTAGLAPQATAFANRLAESIRDLSPEAVAALDDLLVRVRPPSSSQKSSSQKSSNQRSSIQGPVTQGRGRSAV